MDEIDLERMEHIQCGGMVFEMETHARHEKVYWCMNCGEEIHVLVED